MVQRFGCVSHATRLKTHSLTQASLLLRALSTASGFSFFAVVRSFHASTSCAIGELKINALLLLSTPKLNGRFTLKPCPGAPHVLGFMKGRAAR